MHRFLALSIFSVLVLTAESQITRYTVWDFRDSLKSAGIDSLIIYSKECKGESLFVMDSCHWQQPHYLMWQANGSFYIKKFELCYKHKTLLLDSLKPYQFYFDNKKVIDSEEISKPAYIQYQKKGNRLTKEVINIEVDHDCFFNFSFSIGADIIEKNVSQFNLTTKDFKEGKNINYNKNQKTKLKNLIELSEYLIRQLQSDPKSGFE